MTIVHNISHINRFQLILGFVASILTLFLVLVFQWRPSVPDNPTLDKLAINTIEQLIVDNAPARIGIAGELTLHLDATELNLLSAFLLQNVPGLQDVTADVVVEDGSAYVDLSVPVVTPISTLFFNIHAQLKYHAGQFEFNAVRVGRLAIPSALVHFMGKQLRTRLENTYVNYQQISDLQKSVRAVSFQENMLEIKLDWDPQLLARVQTQAEQLLLSEQDKERILFYYDEILKIIQAQDDSARSISLSALLFPLFHTALLRADAGSNALNENRTLLQALSLYVNESDLKPLVNPLRATTSIKPRRLNVTIQRRTDLAQHFTSSAAMGATVGAGVAGVLATSKEVHDARHRTGFSFSDLTANIAGVALGIAATQSPAAALSFAQRLAAASEEADYMPRVARENGGLTEDDFYAQFTDRNSEAYMAKLADIDAQIAALPIYR